MDRRTLLKTMGGAAGTLLPGAFAPAEGAPPQTARGPNIVVIVSDDQGCADAERVGIWIQARQHA